MPASKPAPKALDDTDIAGRITRFYPEPTPTELAGLIATWRATYKAGIEYPEAPRYPPGMVALLMAKVGERARTR